jgi:hypothetical protein
MANIDQSDIAILSIKPAQHRLIAPLELLGGVSS